MSIKFIDGIPQAPFCNCCGEDCHPFQNRMHVHEEHGVRLWNESDEPNLVEWNKYLEKQQMKTMKQFHVEDMTGKIHVITADTWQMSGSQLRLLLDSDIVACFAAWQYWFVVVNPQDQDQQDKQG